MGKENSSMAYFEKINSKIKQIFFNSQSINGYQHSYEDGFSSGFNWSLGTGYHIDHKDLVNFFKQLNLDLLKDSWKNKPINLSKWVEINELIILNFSNQKFEFEFIQRNAINTSTILSYHLLENISQNCGFWNEDGIVMKEIPPEINKLLLRSNNMERKYEQGEQISSLEHKLIIFIESSPIFLQNLFKGLDQAMNYELNELKKQGMQGETETIYKKFSRHRNIVSHGKNANLWESILLSLIFGLIHFGFNL